MSKKKKEFKDIAVGEAAESVSDDYLRPRWKHYVRWLVFLWIMFLYVMLFMNSYRMHFLLHKPFVIQELIVFFICTFMLLPLVLSLILEVDHVIAGTDELVLQNLLIRKHETWDNVVKFWNPIYMKFAILKTKGFIYLLNRRDLPRFEKLVETIRLNSKNLPK